MKNFLQAILVIPIGLLWLLFNEPLAFCVMMLPPVALVLIGFLIANAMK